MKAVTILAGSAALAGTLMACNRQAPLDQARLDEIKQEVRRIITPNGTVLAVEMTRADDNRATGYADVRDANGREGRYTCTATRNREAATFAVACEPPAGSVAPGQASAPPSAGEGAAAPAGNDNHSGNETTDEGGDAGEQ